jgi:MFS family permease
MDPARPDDEQLIRLGALLGAARWSMLLSYALLFLLAPLLPGVLANLGLGVTRATQVAAVLDLARLVSFWAVGVWSGWRGKAWPLVVAIAVLPVAFLLTLFGGSVPTVIAGELVFGACSGLLYTAALYYAMVVKNATVEAGGAHEGLIGVGFALGPLSGLCAQWLEPFAGGRVAAVLLSLSPMCFLLTGFALARLHAGRAERLRAEARRRPHAAPR